MTGTDSHEIVAPLVAAWALDACPPDEDGLVREHLDRCDVCAAEARALRDTVADLGGTHRRPPAGLAARLRSAAPVRRRPAPAAPGYAQPYAAQVAALDLLLTGLDEDHWGRIAAYGEWSVHDLLAHLTATDSLIAAALGVAVDPPLAPGSDPESRTREVLAFARSRTAEQARHAWRAQAEALCGALLAGPAPTGTIAVGWAMPVPDALVARAFETWIHSEDIGGVLARPTVTPLPEHLNPMADLAVRTLPLATATRVTAPEGRHVRLHLTGPGGGTWTVPVAPPAPGSTPPASLVPDAEVTADIVEFCRLVGDRRRPEQLSVSIAGDTRLGLEWLAAAPALAVP
ncbi:maleylpyruvate isomerase family mycothiol-dependent enzyme [Actinoplanes flavus]|uniref:Maleylpyruvate isomerase family mycothiol-dependent enzyme n=1 Tax=Actinoplanes flavus TaxID=2820290 RepID=A0ABS3UXY3_9ACTN|nr:maleylpyruvate isomerase family mycothiol-dependent enzyme [Actinoplanes flavus]MBO3743447.1 maleylpyruvate isomerase family mycothiol-dependent enzyme [Actinoplanes flavus]